MWLLRNSAVERVWVKGGSQGQAVGLAWTFWVLHSLNLALLSWMVSVLFCLFRVIL